MMHNGSMFRYYRRYWRVIAPQIIGGLLFLWAVCWCAAALCGMLGR